MVLILIFAEALGLYGLIVGLILASSASAPAGANIACRPPPPIARLHPRPSPLALPQPPPRVCAGGRERRRMRGTSRPRHDSQGGEVGEQLRACSRARRWPRSTLRVHASSCGKRRAALCAVWRDRHDELGIGYSCRASACIAGCVDAPSGVPSGASRRLCRVLQLNEGCRG